MNSSIHIDLAGTYVIDANGGVLHRIIINTTANGTITVYDNTEASGIIIAVLKASVVENSYEYELSYINGLTIKTAAASDITVVYN